MKPDREDGTMGFGAADDSFGQQSGQRDVDTSRLRDELFLETWELNLNVRVENILAKMGIRLIGDLVQKTEAEMRLTKNFGHCALRSVRESLADRGLSLGMGTIPRWEEEVARRRSVTKDQAHQPIADNVITFEARIAALEALVRRSGGPVTISCCTNIDQFRQVRWPTTLSCVPAIGDRIEGFEWSSNKVAAILRVCGITHAFDRNQQPYLSIELHL